MTGPLSRLAVVVAVAFAAPAHAALTTYADRAAFTAAAGPLAVEGFQSCANLTIAFTGPLDAASDNDACGPGDIAPGIAFVDDPGPDGNAMFLAAAGFSGNGSTALGQTTPASDALNIDLSVPVTEVGFDIFQNFGGGAQLPGSAIYTVRVFTGSTLLGAFDVPVEPSVGGFFGVASDTDLITRISLNNALAFDMIDDIAFTTDDVPEPAPLAFLAIGLAALATRRRLA